MGPSNLQPQHVVVGWLFAPINMIKMGVKRGNAAASEAQVDVGSMTFPFQT